MESSQYDPRDQRNILDQPTTQNDSRRTGRPGPHGASDDTAEGIRSLEAERRDPGPDLETSGGMGANPSQAYKGRADDRALREAGVQSGTQRDPKFPEEDE
jgi:hypothetical protein